MKLKRISCTQFAGVRDCDIALKEGVNVIFGKNESGKSTLVNLISRTLFQNARLDGRRDREFLELYFPAAKKGSAIVGDFADGKLTLETERGVYIMSKEWGADARCTLSTPDGIIRDQAAIDAALKEVLVYGEGVYADMLLSSQRGTDAALQTILDASKKTDAKREITDAVSRAFAEGGGISMDAIEQAIRDKIEQLAGKHWDMEHEAPVRKAGRWATGLGEVLRAYYTFEDAKAVLEEITHLEHEADRRAAEHMAADAAAREAQAAYEDFQVFASRLTVQREREKELGRLNAEQVKYEALLQDWPETERQMLRAKQLQSELEAGALKTRFEKAKKLVEALQALLAELEGRQCPVPEEISGVRAAQRRAAALENRLCGMNLSAILRTFGDHAAEIRSLRTGELLPLSDASFAITEAVMVTVPGVLELQLAPADVDVVDLERKITQEREAVRDVLKAYGVQSLEQLEELAQTLSGLKREREALQMRLDVILDGADYEDLARAAEALPAGLRPVEEVETDVRAHCAGTDIRRFITAKETVIEGYEREYESKEALAARLSELTLAKKKVEEAAASSADIPDAFRAVPDPEEYLEVLQAESRRRQQEREAALTAKTAAASKLETYRENIVGDPVYDAQKAENALQEQKTLLRHWVHIAEVFAKQKETVRNDPMQDIADHFARYLAVISDGGVSSEFPEGDKLNMHIYSRDRLLDYGKLSEGTKETVSLAFRLAVLEHLFPDGGGLIVLDDPFTDMDAERTAQACALVKECALRHQVIFLTCKEEYLSIFGEPSIRL